MKANIIITIREDILDPAGKATLSLLNQEEGSTVTDLRIGKYISLNLDEDDKELATRKVVKLCDEILANPVTENYKFELVNE
ncbi:MAG: phosphoribosylformylglycinamidine synthase subunit PurS [Nitrospinota bacterium]